MKGLYPRSHGSQEFGRSKVPLPCVHVFRKHINLLGQWLNFKLFGITYLVGKIKFKLFFSGSLADLFHGNLRAPPPPMPRLPPRNSRP